MPQLLAVAEYITKTHAICMKCGQPANYTQRTFESEERVAVGGEGCTKPAAASASSRTRTRRRCMKGESLSGGTGCLVHPPFLMHPDTPHNIHAAGPKLFSFSVSVQ